MREEESDQDEIFVSDLANKYKIPFHHISFDTNNYALTNKLSVQMAARELRYKWFEKVRQEISANYIAIAHNQNDNIETFFINMVNGSGLKGLRAIKNKNNFSNHNISDSFFQTIVKNKDLKETQLFDDNNEYILYKITKRENQLPDINSNEFINDIKKILEPLIVPPTKDDDPDFYLDYGSDTSYHTKTGKGECAA